MSISAQTRLSDLLARYPFLKEKLPEVNASFEMLRSPLAKVMLRIATIAEMSKRSGMEEQKLIAAIQGLIEQHG